MTQPLQLSETFVQKANEFYELLETLVGKEHAPATAVDLFSDGKETSDVLHDLALDKVFAKVEAQAVCLDQPIGEGLGSFLAAVVETGETFNGFKKLFSLWHENLWTEHCSRAEAARSVLRVLRARPGF